METPVPAPPSVATDPATPPGILEKPVSTTGGLTLRQPRWPRCALLVIGVRNHTRLKAARPASKTNMESTSVYARTLGGDIQPIQCRALCHVRIAAGLFTLIVPSGSIMRPPPALACHSRALHIKASLTDPCHTYPQKSLCPLARSARWIVSAMVSSSVHVRGAWS